MADLPILPDQFEVVPRAAARRQGSSSAIEKLLAPRRRRPRRQRLRRRARGRADLRLHRWSRRRRASCRCERALVLVDDRRSAIRDGVRATCAPAPSCDRLERRRALALRGRLAGRHERDARGDRQRPRVAGRRRRLARARADADARHAGRARARDPRLRARRRTGSSTPPSSPTRQGRRTRPLDAAGRRRGDAADRRRRPTRSSRRASRRPRARVAELDASATQRQRAAAALRPHRAAARGVQPSFGFTARRTLVRRPGLLREGTVLTYPRTSSRYLLDAT